MSQPKYDSIWKALPDVVLLALIRLAVPDVGDSIQQWKTDLKVLIDRETDNTYLVIINGIRVLLHLEYQNYLDDAMPLRMFHYLVSLKLHYYQQFQEDIIVLSVVIWAKRARRRRLFIKVASAMTRASPAAIVKFTWINLIGNQSILFCWCWPPFCRG